MKQNLLVWSVAFGVMTLLATLSVLYSGSGSLEFDPVKATPTLPPTPATTNVALDEVSALREEVKPPEKSAGETPEKAPRTGAPVLESPVQEPARAPEPSPSPRKASDIDPLEVELVLTKIREGDLRAMKGDLDAARAAWREARKVGGGLWPVHEGLGDSLARMKLYDDAIREYLLAERFLPAHLAPQKVEISLKRARALEAGGRSAQAVEAYLASPDPERIHTKVRALAKGAGAAAATRAVRARADRGEPRYYKLLAELEDGRGRKGAAAAARARHAIGVSPWDEAGNRKRVAELRDSKQYNLAVELCRAWARAKPGTAEPHRLMGELHEAAGRPEEAFISYTALVDLKPGDLEAHRTLGGIFARMGRVTEAVRQYREVIRRKPEDRSIYRTLLAHYQKTGMNEEADELLYEMASRFELNVVERERVVTRAKDKIEAAMGAGRKEEEHELRRRLGRIGVTSGARFDLKVTMKWDTDTDVDLDVYEPSGERVNHARRKSSAGGVYHHDDTNGYGPEVYTLPDISRGRYAVGAHLHVGSRARVTFEVLLYEGTPREERRTESFVLEKVNDQKFISVIEIMTEK